MDILISIMRDYGWFVALFVLILGILLKFIISNYLKWTNITNGNDLDSDLTKDEGFKHHTFFSNSEYRLAVEIPNLELLQDKPNRQRLFKDLLLITFRTVYDITNGFSKYENIENWTSDKWVDMMTQSINQIIIDTEENARNNGIPEIVIRKFMKWYLENVDPLHEYVLLLGSSKLYDTNIVKTNTLLLVMNLLLVTILGDAERVLGDINGELTGLNYKGWILE